jgi:hypothetical protein
VIKVRKRLPGTVAVLELKFGNEMSVRLIIVDAWHRRAVREACGGIMMRMASCAHPTGRQCQMRRLRENGEKYRDNGISDHVLSSVSDESIGNAGCRGCTPGTSG